MNKKIQRANERGNANHGWLNSWHSFSFASYFDPKNMNFGLLRVLNDDIVKPGGGFGTHAHRNMEIISIVLQGGLSHKDSMGHTQTILPGHVQVMSAGTGIEHSEFNGSNTEDVNFLQIWIFPKSQEIQPKYNQKEFKAEERQNHLQFIVAPNAEDDALTIHQDAWIARTNVEENVEMKYNLHKEGNGLYLFVIEGEIIADGEHLGRRDAIAFSDVSNVVFRAATKADVLLIEVPLTES